MLTLGALGFAAPWLLAGLLALPLVWLLLRITPPQPAATRFPAIRFLFGLRQDDDSSARTPPWMLLLRVLVAALLVLAAARPVLAPGSLLEGQGEVVLAIDDGWASAPQWPSMQGAALAILEEAARRGRPVRLLATAPGPDGALPEAAGPFAPADAAAAVAALEPKPWPTDRIAAAAAARRLGIFGPATAIWVSDGLAEGGAGDFARAMQRLGRLDVLRPEPGGRARLLRPPERGAGRLTVRVDRAGHGAEAATVEALDAEGLRLAAAEVAFADGETSASAVIERPDELLNRIARFRLGGERGAGAVALVGSDWRRRKVGLAAAGGAGHPLLDDRHYLRAAFAPFATVLEGPVEELLEAGIGMLVLTDEAELRRAARGKLAELGGGGRRPAALLGAAARRSRRGPASGSAAPGQAGTRRRAHLDEAAAAGRILRKEPVRGAGIGRRHRGHPPGAGGTGPGTRGKELGGAGGRHPDRDRRAVRRGLDCPCAYLRQCRLVHPGPFRVVSADALPPRRARRGRRRVCRAPGAGAPAGRIRGVDRAGPGRIAAAGRLDRRGAAGPVRAAGPLRAGGRIPGRQSR